MAISQQYVGVPFRQITHRLRVQRGPGRPHLESERPRDEKSGRFLDDDDPTIVTFDEHCQVDVDSLLAIGAIEVVSPPPSPVEGERVVHMEGVRVRRRADHGEA